MTTAVIYHADCLDGFGAAYAAWRRLGKNAVYIGGRHLPTGEGSATHALSLPQHTIYIVDFAYDAATMRQLAVNRRLTILDHHQSAAKTLSPLLDEGIISGVIDQNHSGAALTWRHFHPDTPLPQLLAHIEDIDLWRFKLNGTQEVCAALGSYPMTFASWHGLIDATDRLAAEGRHIVRAERNVVANLRQHAYRMVIDGVDVPVVNAPSLYASQLGNALSVNEPFAAVYYDDASGRKFSLRARDGGMDVAVIAERFGGGGHPRAAGFRLAHGQSPATPPH